MDPWTKHFLEMADGRVPHTEVYRAPISHAPTVNNSISTVKRIRTVSKTKRVNKKPIKRTKKSIRPSKTKKKKTTKTGTKKSKNGVGVRGGLRGKFSNFF